MACDSVANRLVRTDYGWVRMCLPCAHRGHMAPHHDVKFAWDGDHRQCQCEHVGHVKPSRRRDEK